MHMHVQDNDAVRTTIEIPDHLRARLLERAARRGEKGFSRLVQEALEGYLSETGDYERRIRAALSVLGRLDDRAADELKESVRKLRAAWR